MTGEIVIDGVAWVLQSEMVAAQAQAAANAQKLQRVKSALAEIRQAFDELAPVEPDPSESMS